MCMVQYKQWITRYPKSRLDFEMFNRLCREQATDMGQHMVCDRKALLSLHTKQMKWFGVLRGLDGFEGDGGENVD